MTSSDDLIRQARATTDASSAVPKRRQLIVSCMDTRVDPLRMMNANVGDVHILRNAGGLVTADVERSIIVSQRKLETTRVDIVMHTSCGMLGLDEASLNAEVRAAGGEPIRYGAFEDLEAELRRGVALLRSNPALAARSAVRGYVFDVHGRTLQLVVDA